MLRRVRLISLSVLVFAIGCQPASAPSEGDGAAEASAGQATSPRCVGETGKWSSWNSGFRGPSKFGQSRS